MWKSIQIRGSRIPGAGICDKGPANAKKNHPTGILAVSILVLATAIGGGCATHPEPRLALAESSALAQGEREQDCSQRPRPRPESRLGILSWNIHSPPLTEGVAERLQAIGTEVLCARPDVVLLQEVFSADDVESLIELLGFTYQRLPLEEPEEQYKTLPGLGPIVRRGGLYAFVRRDSAWNNADLHTAFYPFEAEGPDWKIYQGDGYADKGIQLLRFRANGEQIAILNTHLQAQYGPSSYDRVRRDQLVEVRALAGSLEDNHVVIAAGDFNTHASFECAAADDQTESDRITLPGFTDPVFKQIRDDWEILVEPFFCDYPNGTHLSANPEYPGDSETWIDFYLTPKATRNLTVEHFELIENDGPDDPYSDHHGLLIWLEF